MLDIVRETAREKVSEFSPADAFTPVSRARNAEPEQSPPLNIELVDLDREVGLNDSLPNLKHLQHGAIHRTSSHHNDLLHALERQDNK